MTFAVNKYTKIILYCHSVTNVLQYYIRSISGFSIKNLSSIRDIVYFCKVFFKIYNFLHAMRIKKGFVLREVAGNKVISGEGIEQIDFNKLLTLNNSAAYLWENICNIDFDAEIMGELLTKKYDIDMETAIRDATSLIESWKNNGIIEE